MKHLNSRLEAFCDGVFAIAMTLLIIDIKLPESDIQTTGQLWQAILGITPSIASFLLSFIVVLITWINHHNHMQWIGKPSGSFLYANGFLLLTVVFIPFPTSLLGEFLFTDHASPAVILYNAVLALQAIGWILISRTAIRNQLCNGEKAVGQIRLNGRFGVFAFALYSLCAVLATWFPLLIAAFTTITWIFWLIFGIRIKQEGEQLLP